MEIVKLKAALMGLPYWPLGGTKLKDEFNKKLDSKTIAQSWELSAHKFGECLIDSGKYKGLKLSEYINKVGNNILGTNSLKYERIKKLIKFLDSKKNLFIQVHPDDKYAYKVEKEPGKTEMWYFFEANEDSYIYYGFNKDVTEEEFLNKLVAGEVLDLINKVKVNPGDAVLVPSGTIHALSSNTFCVEIQQNSNTTYNIWNFGEKPGHRGFQIKKALDTLNYQKTDKCILDKNKFIQHEGYKTQHIVSCEYFEVERLDVDSIANLNAVEESFTHLLCYEGKGIIKFNDTILTYQKGDSIFVPARNLNYQIEGNFIGLITKAK